MTSESFPPNSHKSKTPPTEAPKPKEIESVVQGKAVRRKKGIGKQFKAVFFGGDAKTAVETMVFGVLVPSAKEAMSDAFKEGVDRLIFGDAKRKGGPRPTSGPAGYVQYNRFSLSADKPPMGDTHRQTLSRRARAMHDFDDIVLETRAEAEEVIDRLIELISRHDLVTVADLYALVGEKAAHTDYKWGWEDLRGAGVARVRGGYLLDLPAPEPID